MDDRVVLGIIRDHPCCTTAEVARELGEDHRMVLFRLRALEGRGELESVAGSVPRQWRISGCTAVREGHRPPRYKKVGFRIEWKGERMTLNEWADDRELPRLGHYPRLDSVDGALDIMTSPFRVPRDEEVDE